MLAEMFRELPEQLLAVNLRAEHIVRVHYLLFPFFQLILWHIIMLTVITIRQILWPTLHIIIISFIPALLKRQKFLLDFLQHGPLLFLRFYVSPLYLLSLHL